MCQVMIVTRMVCISGRARSFCANGRCFFNTSTGCSGGRFRFASRYTTCAYARSVNGARARGAIAAIRWRIDGRNLSNKGGFARQKPLVGIRRPGCTRPERKIAPVSLFFPCKRTLSRNALSAASARARYENVAQIGLSRECEIIRAAKLRTAQLGRERPRDHFSHTDVCHD